MGGVVLSHRHRAHRGHGGHREAGDGGPSGGGHAGEPPTGLGVDVLVSVWDLYYIVIHINH